MKKEPFWGISEDDEEFISSIGDRFKSIVEENVEAAFKDIFETGCLFLDVDDEPGFEFTDKNFEFRQKFTLDQIVFMVSEDGEREKAIDFLESLIERIKQLDL